MKSKIETTTFEDLNLNKALLNAIADLEYVYPTEIQKETFPVIMSGRDIIGIAQTGTGKTFAFLLPILRLLTYSKDNKPRVMILVPTRELVVQIVGEIEKLTTYLTLRVKGVYGGTNIRTQMRDIAEGMDIIVGTPGRMLDLALANAVNLKSIKKLIIDEFDEMMNQGFRTQINNILDILPNKRQNLLFSATYSREMEKVVSTFFNSPQKIEVAKHGTPLEQIEQSKYLAANFNTKTNLLKHLIQDEEEMNKVLVFVDSKKFADLLYMQFPEGSEHIGVIHSNKSQNFRLRMVEHFHNGTIRVLIATDIIARGIDISEVSHVINFDIPEAEENYIHRIGRTGRADKKGIAISFVSPIDEANFDNIETLIKMDVPLVELPKSVEISKELIEAEKPRFLGDKNYLRDHSLKNSQGAFHEKSDKNKKVNLGGSFREKVKAKYKKPIKRSGKKRKKK
jgi:ATP-dependent RNA helicase RhlE